METKSKFEFMSLRVGSILFDCCVATTSVSTDTETITVQCSRLLFGLHLHITWITPIKFCPGGWDLDQVKFSWIDKNLLCFSIFSQCFQETIGKTLVFFHSNCICLLQHLFLKLIKVIILFLKQMLPFRIKMSSNICVIRIGFCRGWGFWAFWAFSHMISWPGSRGFAAVGTLSKLTRRPRVTFKSPFN